MDRASDGYPQRGRGGAFNHGKRGGYSSRTYSNSSGNSGSSGSKSQGHAILRSLPVHQGYATPPKQGATSSIIPPSEQPTNFDLNGHNINETFKPRSAYASPRRECKPTSPTKGSNRSRPSTPETQYTPTKPLIKRNNDNLVLDQDARVRLIKIPKAYWTKDVYFAMCKYGTVIKIEMIVGSRSNDAVVVMQ
jgi:RNA-dependent RNA polymerase